jgi:site-specific recombinase XerD
VRRERRTPCGTRRGDPALRHTFAKRLLDVGANLVTVASLLGHERIETTARYTQPTDWDLEKAMGLVETT